MPACVARYESKSGAGEGAEWGLRGNYDVEKYLVMR